MIFSQYFWDFSTPRVKDFRVLGDPAMCPYLSKKSNQWAYWLFDFSHIRTTNNANKLVETERRADGEE